jgi:hypothetical protein
MTAAARSGEQGLFTELIAYLEAMTEIEPHLPDVERRDLHRWYCSPEFTRDSDWPGWVKYLGPRPQADRVLVKPFGFRRRA